MRDSGSGFPRWTIGLLILCGSVPVATAADLSRYRGFQFGADLAAVARMTGSSVARAQTIHSRPALIQELSWRPQPLGPSPQPEAAIEVVFRFLDGALYRIEVTYDRYEIAGLTADDLAAAISAVYGAATRPDAALPPPSGYGAPDLIAARWEDPQYRFELAHSAALDSFKLIGVARIPETAAVASIEEAKRLDAAEAPQREAARRASEQKAADAKEAKSRAANKARFRP
jgi:hypothetical protein